MRAKVPSAPVTFALLRAVARLDRRDVDPPVLARVDALAAAQLHGRAAGVVRRDQAHAPPDHAATAAGVRRGDPEGALAPRLEGHAMLVLGAEEVACDMAAV